MKINKKLKNKKNINKMFDNKLQNTDADLHIKKIEKEVNGIKKIFYVDKQRNIYNNNSIIEKFENKIINIANPKNYLVTDIVYTIERLTLTKAKYNLINKGELNWKIDVSQIFDSIKNCKIEFNDNYLENILKKYFI